LEFDDHNYSPESFLRDIYLLQVSWLMRCQLGSPSFRSERPKMAKEPVCRNHSSGDCTRFTRVSLP